VEEAFGDYGEHFPCPPRSISAIQLMTTIKDDFSLAGVAVQSNGRLKSFAALHSMTGRNQE
jgi:hypothetical protein